MYGVLWGAIIAVYLLCSWLTIRYKVCFVLLVVMLLKRALLVGKRRTKSLCHLSLLHLPYGCNSSSRCVHVLRQTVCTSSNMQGVVVE